ncbi:MAG: NADH-quinone oxidoreductase subunit NuoG [Anaerolineae bacterium]
MDVTLTIDGHTVTVPAGTMIVEAARCVGIEIPVFCYHPKMAPVGMCRMCLVTVGTPAINRETGQPEATEAGKPVIRWQPKPVTACTEPVREGMVVITDSAQVAADRRGILEFLLTSHPLDCPICDKGGECPLQNLTYRHGPGISRFDFASKHHAAKAYPLSDLIVLDRERCILCARCTRFQSEIADDPVLAIENRGRDAMIVSYSEPVFDSHYSGNTTDICPVGALTTRDFRFRARPWELRPVASICNHCGVGCNIVLDTRRGHIARVMPRQNEQVNEVWICDKGRFAHHFHASPQRLTVPLLRRGDRLVESSWDEALQYVATRLQTIRERYGAHAIGGIAGAHLPNEDLYLFQKLLRQVIGSPNVDYRVRLSAACEDDTAFEVGVGCGTDLGRVGRDTAILVLGSNLDEEAPILYLRVAGAARRGAMVINIGGRATKLDRHATHILRCRYGSAAHLVLGLLHVVLHDTTEQGRALTGNEIVPARVEGLAALRAQVARWTPERVAEVSGVPAELIRAAAHTFATARNGIIIYGGEAGNHPVLRRAIANLAIVTGFVGRPNNGVIAVLAHANSRGAEDLGIVPHRLPGYIPVEQPGISAMEMVHGGVRALLVAAADPLAITARQADLEFLVVQELFLSATARQADVVLPAAAPGERAGSYTNIERRVQHFQPALLPPGMARPDWSILRHLAVLMGADWDYATSAAVLEEMAHTVSLYTGMSCKRLTQPVEISRPMAHYIYAGMSYQSKDYVTFQWPTRAEDPSHIFRLEWLEPPDPPAGEMTLVAPRVLYDGGTLLGQSDILSAHVVRPHVALSPQDAAARGLSDGDKVCVRVCEREMNLSCRVQNTLPPGVIVIPRNLAGNIAEMLLSEERSFGPAELRVDAPRER